MTDSVEAVVVGAGVVGLAIARRLALSGREVVVLEAAPAIGSATSSRNSEVVHAGIYYPPGSLKARLCVSGRRQLYAFAASHGVAHRRLGKLIVAASDAEIPILQGLCATGRGNGVDDLRMLSAAEAIRREPNLSCRAALLSPSTGIVDSHGLMLALRGDAEAAGAVVALSSRLRRAAAGAGRFRLAVAGRGGAVFELDCRILVNAAGLHAQEVARGIAGLDPALIPHRHLAKGSYYAYRGRAPFAALVYPVPEAGSLGLHYTVDLGGQARFGPDHEVVDCIDYDVDSRRADLFYRAIRRFFPGLADGALAPDYAGIRPQVQETGGPMRDFVVQDPTAHGVPGLINLFGIESPGLTACLALADHVVAALS